MLTKLTSLVFLFGKAIPRTTVENPWFKELEQSYNVEAWDIGGILLDGMPRFPYGTAVKERSLPVPTIDAFRHNLLQKNPNETVIIFNVPMVHLRRNAERVVKAISTLNYNYVVRDVSNLFSGDNDFRWYRAKLQRIKRKSIFGYRNRRLWFWNSVKPPLFALVASKIVVDWMKVRGLRTRFVRAHGRDYEHYLELTSNNYAPVKISNEGVFLDSPMFGSNDMVYDGVQPEITAEQYYSQVRRVLLRLWKQEALDGFNVGLHPSNIMSPEDVRTLLSHDIFKVSKGNTPALIQNARLVAGHHSSAFGLAVLFEKPVCLFVPAKHNTFTREKHTITMARVLRRRVNYPETVSLDVGMDQKAYRRFRCRYVKEPDTADMSHYTILHKELQKCVE